MLTELTNGWMKPAGRTCLCHDKTTARNEPNVKHRYFAFRTKRADISYVDTRNRDIVINLTNIIFMSVSR